MARHKLEIGLFTTRENMQTRQLLAEINKARPGICKLFLQPENGSPTVTLSRSKILWDGVDVSKLRCAYLYGFRYCNPIMPRVRENVDWTLWQADYIAVQQNSSFLLSAFSEMERRGVRLFNPLSAHIANFTKLNLLESLRARGMDIPQLICTNDQKAVAKFTADKDLVYLWRPATGRAAWQLFREQQKKILMAPSSPPVLVAETKQGPFMRSFVFAGQVVLTLSFGAATQTPLERLELFKYNDFPQQHDALLKVAKQTDLRWGLIHWIYSDGKAWIYDIDTDPELSVLPKSFRNVLTQIIASGLISKDYKFDLSKIRLPRKPQLRDQPFLRRMLSILFEIEGRKYNPVEKP